MTALDQEWEEIRRQRDRQVKLKAQLERLKAQQVTLNGEVGQRKQRLKKEEQDVDQLEAFSWLSPPSELRPPAGSRKNWKPGSPGSNRSFIR